MATQPGGWFGIVGKRLKTWTISPVFAQARNSSATAKRPVRVRNTLLAARGGLIRERRGEGLVGGDQRQGAGPQIARAVCVGSGGAVGGVVLAHHDAPLLRSQAGQPADPRPRLAQTFNENHENWKRRARTGGGGSRSLQGRKQMGGGYKWV